MRQGDACAALKGYTILMGGIQVVECFEEQLIIGLYLR